MVNEYQLRILPEQAASEQSLKTYISREKGLDIRYVNVKVQVFINEVPDTQEYTPTEYKNVSGKPQVIVVGAGPGGLFAALRLIELGLRPIVIERGKNVRESAERTYAKEKKTWQKSAANTRLTLNRITVLVKVVPGHIQTVSFTPEARNAAMWTRF